MLVSSANSRPRTLKSISRTISALQPVNTTVPRATFSNTTCTMAPPQMALDFVEFVNNSPTRKLTCNESPYSPLSQRLANQPHHTA